MTRSPSFSPPATVRACSLGNMLAYGTGECANSLVMNGIFGFAMLYYTKALGLDPRWAGFAMSISVFWEAISEPLMGHVSDNTRSRWGRRHPYMLAGGLLMAACSYLIWMVPETLQSRPLWILGYLILINLLLRTGLTMFFIPYLALGFEMCTDYRGRSRLQGIRQIFNMAANFAGPALAWTLFFQDQKNVQATTISANYHHMGAVFAVATVIFVLVVVISTYSWREKDGKLNRESQKGFWWDLILDIKRILLDPYPRWVFVFIFVVCSGMVIVSSLQIFVYDDFMKFSAIEKSIAHSSSIVGMALGAVLSIGLAGRFDKKGAVLIGGVISITGNILLSALFLTGLVPPGATWSVGRLTVPIALILFVIGHAGYWLGNGIMLPTSTAMMADVSEVNFLKTNVSKDGAYSAVFSLSMRMAIAFSLMLSGFCLHFIGYKTGLVGIPVVQSSPSIWQLGLITFVIGGLISGLALVSITPYRITQKWLETLRQKR